MEDSAVQALKTELAEERRRTLEVRLWLSRCVALPFSDESAAHNRVLACAAGQGDGGCPP